jgi:5-oxoprolinase (ATP-hydrolysing)
MVNISANLRPMAGFSWQFWIDRGGTFTDVVALRPDGSLETAKLLSENPEQYDDAAAEGIRQMVAAWPETVPIEAVKMGTTVATNALLERHGSPTALIVTKGFADALAIGYQNRPDIFALNIIKPEPLYERVIEASERLNADGEVLKALDEEAIAAALRSCASDGITSIAICLVHGYRYPQHENRLAAIAEEAGLQQVSVSHDVGQPRRNDAGRCLPHAGIDELHRRTEKRTRKDRDAESSFVYAE